MKKQKRVGKGAMDVPSLAFYLALLFGGSVHLRVQVAGQYSFSDVRSRAYFKPGEEVVILQHNTSPPTGGAVTHWWFAQREYSMQETLLRIYVDDESSPGIEAPITAFAGTAGSGDVGRLPTQSPFGSTIGGSASWNSVYSTIRIPFTTNVRMTVLVSDNITECVCGDMAQHGCCFWSTVHGIDQMQVKLSDVLAAPYNARLRMYAVKNRMFQAYETVPIIQSWAMKGAVIFLTMSVQSGNFAFADGCFRAFFNNGNVSTLLSSGMTENFLAANDFDTVGPGAHHLYDFHLPEAGMTHKNVTDGVSVACYRWYGRDPIVIDHGMRMEWQIGAYYSEKGKCVDQGYKVQPEPTATKVTLYAFTYEW